MDTQKWVTKTIRVRKETWERVQDMCEKRGARSGHQIDLALFDLGFGRFYYDHRNEFHAPQFEWEGSEEKERVAKELESLRLEIAALKSENAALKTLGSRPIIKEDAKRSPGRPSTKPPKEEVPEYIKEFAPRNEPLQELYYERHKKFSDEPIKDFMGEWFIAHGAHGQEALIKLGLRRQDQWSQRLTDVIFRRADIDKYSLHEMFISPKYAFACDMARATIPTLKNILARVNDSEDTLGDSGCDLEGLDLFLEDLIAAKEEHLARESDGAAGSDQATAA